MPLSCLYSIFILKPSFSLSYYIHNFVQTPYLLFDIPLLSMIGPALDRQTYQNGSSRPEDVGIIDMEVYFPSTCVQQSKLGKFSF